MSTPVSAHGSRSVAALLESPLGAEQEEHIIVSDAVELIPLIPVFVTVNEGDEMEALVSVTVAEELTGLIVVVPTKVHDESIVPSGFSFKIQSSSFPAPKEKVTPATI